MEEFDYPSEYGGYTTCEDLLLEVQNTHKIVQNLRINKDIAELSTYVNHLVFLHLYRMWIWIVLMEKNTVHIPILGKMLRWHSFFIKKLQSEKRSVYFTKRWDGDIIFWRTQTLVDSYYSKVDILLKASSKTIDLHEKLIKICKEMPIEIWEE